MPLPRKSRFFLPLKLWLASITGESAAPTQTGAGGGPAAAQKNQSAQAAAGARPRVHVPKATLESVPRPTEDFFRKGGI